MRHTVGSSWLSRTRNIINKAPQVYCTRSFPYLVNVRLRRSYITSVAVDEWQDDEAFFRYDSGRWLWDEEARLRARYRWFNVSALQQIAASNVGAYRCVSMTKLAEGGFNKVFRLTMNDGSVAIARIPFPGSGSISPAIASEVAAMDFVSIVVVPKCY
jgi:hypothetical protein